LPSCDVIVDPKCEILDSESTKISSVDESLLACSIVLTLLNAIGQSLHLRPDEEACPESSSLGCGVPSCSTGIASLGSKGKSKPNAAIPRTRGAAVSHGKYLSLTLMIRFSFLMIDGAEFLNSSADMRCASKDSAAALKPIPGRSSFLQSEISNPANDKTDRIR